MSDTSSPPSPRAGHPLLILCTVMLTTVITAIDATIANVALPHMQGSLSATQDQISWVLTSYIVATAIFIPPTGFLATRMWRLIPNTGITRGLRFDFFGFGLLSVAIASVQLMLDRGPSVNWFESTEIVVEAALAAMCFYMFVVHIFTARNPFIEPRLFADRNLVAGLFIIALASVVLMGQMALLPSFLQQLMHMPVDTTGLLMMPRGIASMIAMVITARLIGRVDPRWIMVTGLVVLGLSMYEMSQISLYVDNATVIRLGFVQGFGMSLITGPMAALVFTTLAEELYVEGAAMYNLMRSIGGSIGISLLFSSVAENTQVVHSRLAENITAFEGAAPLPAPWQWSSTAGAMTLDAEIIRQAASVAYLHAYLVMALMVLLTIPLCFLFRKSHRLPPAESAVSAGAEH